MTTNGLVSYMRTNTEDTGNDFSKRRKKLIAKNNIAGIEVVLERGV